MFVTVGDGCYSGTLPRVVACGDLETRYRVVRCIYKNNPNHQHIHDIIVCGTGREFGSLTIEYEAIDLAERGILFPERR